MAGFLPPIVAVLTAQTSEFTSKLGAARAEVAKTTGASSKAFTGLASVGKAALFGIGGAALAVGTYSIHMADEFESSHARLETSLHNSGAAAGIFDGQIKSLDDKFGKLGFGMSETESALSTLVNVTHNGKKAIDLMGLAANIARGRHIDLGSAVGILAKVETGHIALLGRYGINVKDATGKTIDQQTAIKRLTDMYSGNASAYTGTFAGKTQALKTQIENLSVRVGLWLIPKLVWLIGIVQKVITWFGKHQTAAKALGIIVGVVLVAAITAYIASMVAAAAATLTAAAPILAIIAVIGLLIGAVILVWTHWDQIWNWIAHHKAYAFLISVILPIVPVILAIIAAAKYVSEHWSGIWAGIQAIVETVAQAIVSAFSWAINTVIDAINQLIRAYNDTLGFITGHKIGALSAFQGDTNQGGGDGSGSGRKGRGAAVPAGVLGGAVQQNDAAQQNGAMGKITVNVDARGSFGLDPAQIGKAVHDALDSYAHRNTVGQNIRRAVQAPA